MKKLLALLLSAAMAMSVAVMPASAAVTDVDVVDQNAFYDDFKGINPENFTDNTITTYMSQRVSATNVYLMETDEGAIYCFSNSNDNADGSVVYNVIPGKVVSIETINATENTFEISFSADQNSWTAAEDVNVGDAGIVQKTDGTQFSKKYYSAVVPENMNYVKVLMPKGYTRWNQGIVSVRQFGEFTDELKDEPTAFMANKSHPERYKIEHADKIQKADDMGDNVGSMYHWQGRGDWAEPTLIYRAVPGMLLKVSVVSSDNADFIIEGSADCSNDSQYWTSLAARKVSDGKINDRSCLTYYAQIPENVYYVRVKIPYQDVSGEPIGAGNRWSFGIRSVSVSDELISDYTYPEEFEDELDTPGNSFTDKTAAGYLKNRIDAVYLERRDTTEGDNYQGGMWQANAQFDGTDAYFTYKVTPGKVAEVLYINGSVLTGDVITIKTSADGVNYTTVDGGYVKANTVYGGQGYYKYALMPADAEYMRVCFPEKGTYTNWQLYISKITLRSIDFNDTLDSDPANFNDSSKTDYIPQRAYLDNGGTPGIEKFEAGYGHCYGYTANTPSIFYHVYPGRTLSVVTNTFGSAADGNTGSDYRDAYVEFTADNGTTWTRVKTSRVELGDVTVGNNTYIQRKYMVTVPEGAYLAKIVIPGMRDAGDNWQFGIDTVTLNKEVIPHEEYEWDEPSASIEEDTAYVGINVNKYSGNAENVTAYFASYDSDGYLVDVQSQTIKLTAEEGSNLGEFFVYGTTSATNKAFVWGENCRPLGAVIPVTAESVQ